jgi:two-component system sporulation sensor kinase A
MAEALQRLNEQLIENERLAAIGITSAKLAHEIANPLNGMGMTAKLLERHLARQGSLADEKVTSALQTMNREINHLSALLQDFRSLYRRENYNLQPTPMALVIKQVLALESPECAARRIQIEQSCPEDLPLVMADQEKLKQALLNLCKNAVEAMPNGGRLIVRASSSDDQVILEVNDTGIGIPDGIDILEPFATTKPSGTGLGLVIVRQIIAAHKGTMTYESERNRGTTFRLILPRHSV